MQKLQVEGGTSNRPAIELEKERAREIAQEAFARADRLKARGVPPDLDMKMLREIGERRNAEARHRSKTFAPQLEKVVVSAKRLLDQLRALQECEATRPVNQPFSVELFLASLLSAPTPEPVLSVEAEQLRLVSQLASLTLAELQRLKGAIMPGPGRPKDHRVHELQRALRAAGLGDERIGLVLAEEGLYQGPEVAERAIVKERVRASRRRGTK